MTLRYKVPQNVQREDTILFFITMKQLIVLMVCGGFSYLMFVQLSKAFVLSQFETMLIALPFILGCAFCFVKIKGLSLFQLCLLTIEQSLLPGRRYWQSGSGPLVSSTTSFSTKNTPTQAPVAVKNVSKDKIKNLAELIDNGGKPNEALNMQNV